ncbi:hypothetical protein [Mesobacillus foraminis]|jgi:hypothetical protein|uniref:Uncharacterized protein n=1 Tax=Mesobacillus foraminis TaxID=279826 RepID=A0A4R2BK77_9BACI|nr:hypothetical protein [Mesobacillus foraminis]TCN27063.1 hypothetical protein EV146_1023 [Mesobacillus foraminis]
MNSNNKKNVNRLEDKEREFLSNSNQVNEEFKNQKHIPDQQNRLKDQENRQ